MRSYARLLLARASSAAIIRIAALPRNSTIGPKGSKATVNSPLPTESARRVQPLSCMNKRTDGLKCHDRIVIEQKMGCRGNFDHLNVAFAKPWEVGKRLILL